MLSNYLLKRWSTPLLYTSFLLRDAKRFAFCQDRLECLLVFKDMFEKTNMKDF